MAYRPMIPGECEACYLEDAARFAAMPKALKPKVLAELRKKDAQTAANIKAYHERIIADEASRVQKLAAEEAARLKAIANLKAREESMRAPSRAAPGYINMPIPASQNLTNAFKNMSRKNRRSARKAKKNTRRR
jgi:hypothetical protein